MFGNIFYNYSFSSELSTVVADVHVRQDEEIFVPKKLESSIKNSLMHIYGKDSVDELYSHIESQIKKAKLERRQDLIEEDLKRDSTFNQASFGREYESKWTGSVENAFFNGDKFDRNRILQKPEKEASGRSNKNAYYVLSVDVGRRGC